jgi:hypothetical protein
MSTDSARERAAIVIVSRDATVQKSLSEELSGRDGVDYQIPGKPGGQHGQGEVAR